MNYRRVKYSSIWFRGEFDFLENTYVNRYSEITRKGSNCERKGGEGGGGKKEEFAFVKTGTGSSRQGKKGGGAT